MILRALTILFLMILAPGLNAQECSISPLSEAESTGSPEFSEALISMTVGASALSARLYNVTQLNLAEERQELETLRANVKQLKPKLEALNSGIILLNSVPVYFQGLSKLAESELYLSGKTEFFDSQYELQLNTQDFLQASPTQHSSMPGVEARVEGSTSHLKLNTRSRHAVWMNFLAKSKKAEENGDAYYQTSKCLLARLYIEKAKGISAILNEPHQLKLSESIKACGDMSFSDLAGSDYLALFDNKSSAIQNNVTTNFDYLSEADQKLWTDLAESKELDDLQLTLFMGQVSALDEAEADIKQLGQALHKAENQLAVQDPFMGLLWSATQSGLDLVNRHRAGCHSSNPFIEKFLFDTARRYWGNVSRNEISESTALLFTHGDAILEKNIIEAMVAETLRILEMAIFSGYIHSGEMNLGEARALLKAMGPDLESTVRKQIESSDVPAAMAQKMKLSEAPMDNLLEDYPGLVEVAQGMHKIASPNTPVEELEFEPRYVLKLFEGLLGTLNKDHYKYINQIVTRSSFEAQAELWTKYKAEIEQNQKDLGFECVHTGLMGRIGNWFKKKTTGGERNIPLENSCEFLSRLVAHLGLENDQEPQKMGDIWKSFTENDRYDDTDIEGFEKRYREFLLAKSADFNRVLETPLEKLNLQGIPDDGASHALYDLIAKYPGTKFTQNAFERALRFVKSNEVTEILVIQQSQSIKDLHGFILGSMTLNRMLGMKAFNNYLPGWASDDSGPLYAKMYVHHDRYQAELIRMDENGRLIPHAAVDRLEIPFLIFGGAWLARSLFYRLPGLHGLASGMHATADASRLIYQGFLGVFPVIFTLGLANSTHWYLDVNDQQEVLERMRFSDYLIFPGDYRILTYESYLARRNNLEKQKKEARFEMILYGSFTVLSLGSTILEPYLAARAAAGLPIAPRFMRKISESLSQILYFTRRGATMDLRYIRHYRGKLGNPPNLKLETLKAAAQNINTPAAQNAYQRIIHRLGQRITKAAGHPEKLKIISEKYFGTPHGIHDLTKIADEFHRLFPPIIKGGL